MFRELYKTKDVKNMQTQRNLRGLWFLSMTDRQTDLQKQPSKLHFPIVDELTMQIIE